MKILDTDYGGGGGPSGPSPSSSSSLTPSTDPVSELLKQTLLDVRNKKRTIDPHKKARQVLTTIKKEQGINIPEDKEQALTDEIAAWIFQANRRKGAFGRESTAEQAAHEAAEAVAKNIGVPPPPTTPSHNPGVFHCFPAGTKVSMACGSSKNIEEVRVGDRVRSYDRAALELAEAEVLELQSGIEKGYWRLNKGILEITGRHPIYVRKHDGREGWAVLDKKASTHMTLEIGDRIMTLQEGWMIGEWVEVIAAIEYVPKTTEVYNLKAIGGPHTFFANGVLVHNIKAKF